MLKIEKEFKSSMGASGSTSRIKVMAELRKI